MSFAPAPLTQPSLTGEPHVHDSIAKTTTSKRPHPDNLDSDISGKKVRPRLVTPLHDGRWVIPPLTHRSEAQGRVEIMPESPLINRHASESYASSVNPEHLAAFHKLATQLSRIEIPAAEFYAHNIVNNVEATKFAQSWYSNPRLFAILFRLGRLEALDDILRSGVTDLWLPLPKRLIRKWTSGEHEAAAFTALQELGLDKDVRLYPYGQHFRVVDLDDLGLEELDSLGSGGVGEVYCVKSRRDGRMLACKIMSRPPMYKKHRELMLNFEREVSGMLRARHRHCVTFAASWTSMESVSILSSPVADGDLAQFLKEDLDELGIDILNHAVGCITSALAYLHELGIR